MSDWIACADRLPADGQTVDVWVHREKGFYSESIGRMADIEFRGGEWLQFNDELGDQYPLNLPVTHWMELPAPPS